MATGDITPFLTPYQKADWSPLSDLAGTIMQRRQMRMQQQQFEAEQKRLQQSHEDQMNLSQDQLQMQDLLSQRTAETALAKMQQEAALKQQEQRVGALKDLGTAVGAGEAGKVRGMAPLFGALGMDLHPETQQGAPVTALPPVPDAKLGQPSMAPKTPAQAPGAQAPVIAGVDPMQLKAPALGVPQTNAQPTLLPDDLSRIFAPPKPDRAPVVSARPQEPTGNFEVVTAGGRRLGGSFKPGANGADVAAALREFSKPNLTRDEDIYGAGAGAAQRMVDAGAPVKDVIGEMAKIAMAKSGQEHADRRATMVSTATGQRAAASQGVQALRLEEQVYKEVVEKTESNHKINDLNVQSRALRKVIQSADSDNTVQQVQANLAMMKSMLGGMGAVSDRDAARYEQAQSVWVGLESKAAKLGKGGVPADFRRELRQAAQLTLQLADEERMFAAQKAYEQLIENPSISPEHRQERATQAYQRLAGIGPEGHSSYHGGGGSGGGGASASTSSRSTAKGLAAIPPPPEGQTEHDNLGTAPLPKKPKFDEKKTARAAALLED